jgi:hypothetical protein
MTDKPRTRFIAFSRAEGFIAGVAAIVAAVLMGLLIDEGSGWIGRFAGALAAQIRIAWPLRVGAATRFACCLS